MTVLGHVLRSLPTALLVVSSLAAARMPCAAQTTGEIRGVVLDPEGAAIPGATITVTNRATGLVRATVSQSHGDYVVSLLPPGLYDLTAEAQGFARYTRKGIELLVNQILTLRIDMALGAITATVEVVGAPTPIDTQTPARGEVITNEELIALPLNGRNFLQLAILVPGSVPGIELTENFTSTTPGSSSVNMPQVNGLRSQSNNILLDGIDNNELFLGQGSAVPNPDAIQEFKVQTNMYGVEFGARAGSIVNVVTKAGTDTFHGSLWDFLRNDIFDARNFFSAETPKLIRNQFGWSLGGPIIKGSTHFFHSFEGLRLRQGITRSGTVPTIAEKRGDFSQSTNPPVDPTTGMGFPGHQIPMDRIDPVAARLTALYPDPNTGTNVFNSSPTSETNLTQALVRVDHEVGDNDYLFVRYFGQTGDSLSPFTATFLGSIDVPVFPLNNEFNFQNLAVSETHVFSGRTVNEVRFGYKRDVFHASEQAIQRDAADFGFTFPTTIPDQFPQWGVAGFTVMGQTEFSGDKTTQVFQLNDTLSHTRGRHRLKLGFDIRRMHMDSVVPAGFNGAFLFVGHATGNGFADFLLGRPLFFLQSGGNPELALSASSINVFAEDAIPLRSNLTLTLGIRYENSSWPVDRENRVAAIRPGQQSTVRPDAPRGLVYPGDEGIERATVDRDNNNVAPRVGIAWDPTGKGRTSVRAGYGIFYDAVPWMNFLQLQITPPFGFLTLTFVPTAGLADPFGGTSPFLPGRREIPFDELPPSVQVNHLDPEFATPYVHQYNLTVQHEVFQGWVAEASYVGTTGAKLPNTIDINQAVFVPGASSVDNILARRPLGPIFGQLLAQTTQFSSNYNGLQLSVRKRRSARVPLDLLAFYVWSKTIDVVSTPQVFRSARGQPGTVTDSRNPDLDSGLAAFDVPHRLVASVTWELPAYWGDSTLLQKMLSGWALSGIATFQSGFPFTVIDPSDPTVDGTCCNNDRPDLIGDPNAGDRTLDRYFNTAAFQRLTAPSGRPGTAGRNILRGPGTNNVDVSLAKTTAVGDYVHVEFRAEFFNLFNHPQFANPVSDITSPNLGRILDTKPGNERQVQFALKLNF